jgi:alkanesulfonate monooxygenase SsuD/methylene tetrahydromethanopterin reductase-like flavin-dependent oxidoreductase (luciferase family)
MKFGVFDHMDWNGRSVSNLYTERLQLVELYENLGFHAYHLTEHHATLLGMAPSPSIFLSAIAQRTSRLRIGTLVYLLPLHHPVRLLEEIGMLDQLSGGRMEVGFGRGGAMVEHLRYGLDETLVPEMFEEAAEILLKGLGAQELNHEGRFHSLTDVPILVPPVQRRRPGLWYGTNTPQKAAWAAGEGINLLSLMPTAATRKLMDVYHDAWAELGRDPAHIPFHGIGGHQIYVSHTDAEAYDTGRRAWLRWAENFRYLWDRSGRKVPPSVKVFAEDFDEILAGGTVIVGSADTVRGKLKAVERDGRINYYAAELVFGDMTLDEAESSARLFATEVMPAFG